MSQMATTSYITNSPTSDHLPKSKVTPILNFNLAHYWFYGNPISIWMIINPWIAPQLSYFGCILLVVRLTSQHVLAS